MDSFVLRAGERAPRITFEKVRQKCPDLPNLRDHGLTCDRELLRLVGNLEKRCGYALVSEDSLRAMFYQDTGHLPGVGTLCAAMRRLEERHGELEVRWIHRGSTMPDGRRADVGVLRIRRARDRNDRRLIRKSAAQVDRRKNVGGACFAPSNRREVMQELADRVELAELHRESSDEEARGAAEEFRRLYGGPWELLDDLELEELRES
jgi:hypothetical protein